jgi:predicted glycosyltransferase
MKAWIDIDTPPQAQYLLPFRDAFRQRGIETIVTGRDAGITLELLRQAEVDFHPVGKAFGPAKYQKVLGVFGRAHALRTLLKTAGKPDLLVCASRSSALAAWSLGIPSFCLGDYEHVHVAIYRLTGTTMILPEVIDASGLERRGLRKEQIVQYRGLKEDLTFAGLDIDAVPPHHFENVNRDLVKILVRPPAAESHYYSQDSGRVELDLLAYLARQPAVLVVFSPRYPWQAQHLRGIPWINQPVLLKQPVSFLELLKAVDAVICSGGTMLREAAYLGIPAYSIFQSEIGGVDRYLESIGRVTFISSATDFQKLDLAKLGRPERLASNPDLLRELTTLIAEKARAR